MSFTAFFNMSSDSVLPPFTFHLPFNIDFDVNEARTSNFSSANSDGGDDNESTGTDVASHSQQGGSADFDLTKYSKKSLKQS
jgi:hypothetical protein